MTTTQQDRYQNAFAEAMKVNNKLELAVGFIRYEALRKLNSRQFMELSKRNLAGEQFDDLVDGLITGATKL